MHHSISALLLFVASFNLSCSDKTRSIEGGAGDHLKENTVPERSNLHYSRLSGEDIAGITIVQERLLVLFWNLAKPRLIKSEAAFEVSADDRKVYFELLDKAKTGERSLLTYGLSDGISGTLSISVDEKGELDQVAFRPGLFGNDSMITKIIILERKPLTE